MKMDQDAKLSSPETLVEKYADTLFSLNIIWNKILLRSFFYNRTDVVLYQDVLLLLSRLSHHRTKEKVIMKNSIIIRIMIVLFTLGAPQACLAARVETSENKTYIVDRTGERWDVTQAQNLGFIPQSFQYGIGKNAFTPLQDEDFGNQSPSNFGDARIIGVTTDSDAHAYTVKRLRKHEIANTTIAGQAIAAGY